jgi:hypothetical protein
MLPSRRANCSDDTARFGRHCEVLVSVAIARAIGLRSKRYQDSALKGLHVVRIASSGESIAFAG